MMARQNPDTHMSHLEATKLDPRDRAAIEALITEFFQLMDHGPTEKLRDVFVSDGFVIAKDLGIDVRGAQAIADFFGARKLERGFASRHSWSSLRVLDVGDREVRTSAIIVTFIGPRTAGGAKDYSVGNCEDVFRREANGEWRFISRTQVKIIS